MEEAHSLDSITGEIEKENDLLKINELNYEEKRIKTIINF